MTASDPLSLVYLLEDTPLFGGVKIVLRQANLMARRGHRVTIVSPGDEPDWLPLEARFLRTTGLNPGEIPAADVIVASYWTTIAPAMAAVHVAGQGQVVHYCQGYEGIYTHNQAEHAAIEVAYSQPIPAITPSPHLARLLQDQFARPARVVLQPLSDRWHADDRTGPNETPSILITSPFEIDWKGVPTSLRAVQLLRARGHSCRVVRLSQWPQTDDERALLDAEAFHCHVPPADVPGLVRACDLLLAASWEQEGFGMPVLEALAVGVPVIGSDIEAFRDFAAPAARLVPHDDPMAFADAAAAVLADPDEWRARRREGLRIAERFHEDRFADLAEEALRWVASGVWRGAS